MNKDIHGRAWGFPADNTRNTGGVMTEKKDEPVDREKVAAARSRQKAIGRTLQRMFDEVVQEPVPDDFTDILKQIDEGSSKKGANP
jgi:hypothetical protein